MFCHTKEVCFFMMDYEKIKAGVQLLLEGIGEDVNREGLLETPDRIARMSVSYTHLDVYKRQE